MTIEQAIKALEAQREKHGGAVEVFFDCPRCGVAYTPGVLVTQAVVIKAKPSEDRDAAGPVANV
jgi:hypothetical protein